MLCPSNKHLFTWITIIFRVCRPEIYQIKSTIHYTLCNYTQKLIEMNAHSFDTVEKNTVAQELTTVLHLYDHILMEEYSREGTIRTDSRGQFKSPVSLRLADEMQTCGFCGADIFQSYFRCHGHKHGEENFIVCPGCYIEGRACACQNMREQERQSFDVLFNARWNALQALTGVGHSIKSFKGTLSLQEQRRCAADRFQPTIALTIQWIVSLRSHPNGVYFTQLFYYPRLGLVRYG